MQVRKRPGVFLGCFKTSHLPLDDLLQLLPSESLFLYKLCEATGCIITLSESKCGVGISEEEFSGNGHSTRQFQQGFWLLATIFFALCPHCG